MKRLLLVCVMQLALCTALWSQEIPTLLILTTTSGEVQIPIASIEKITYDKGYGTTMYLTTISGTSSITTSYELASIQQMTLANVPDPTGLEAITLPADEVEKAYKFIHNGIVYIIKDGKTYTLF